MTTGRAYNRIDLLYTGKGYDEARANATVYPGTLLLTDSSGEVGPNSVDGNVYDVQIALSQQKQGALITDTIASGSLVPYVTPLLGDVFNMLLESAEAVTLDDFLTVTASGSLRVATSTDRRLFKPLEVLVGTGSGDRFCKCKYVAG